MFLQYKDIGNLAADFSKNRNIFINDLAVAECDAK